MSFDGMDCDYEGLPLNVQADTTDGLAFYEKATLSWPLREYGRHRWNLITPLPNVPQLPSFLPHTHEILTDPPVYGGFLTPFIARSVGLGQSEEDDEVANWDGMLESLPKGGKKPSDAIAKNSPKWPPVLRPGKLRDAAKFDLIWRSDYVDSSRFDWFAKNQRRDFKPRTKCYMHEPIIESFRGGDDVLSNLSLPVPRRPEMPQPRIKEHANSHDRSVYYDINDLQALFIEAFGVDAKVLSPRKKLGPTPRMLVGPDSNDLPIPWKNIFSRLSRYYWYEYSVTRWHYHLQWRLVWKGLQGGFVHNFGVDHLVSTSSEYYGNAKHIWGFDKNESLPSLRQNFGDERASGWNGDQNSNRFERGQTLMLGSKTKIYPSLSRVPLSWIYRNKIPLSVPVSSSVLYNRKSLKSPLENLMDDSKAIITEDVRISSWDTIYDIRAKMIIEGMVETDDQTHHEETNRIKRSTATRKLELQRHDLISRQMQYHPAGSSNVIVPMLPGFNDRNAPIPYSPVKFVLGEGLRSLIGNSSKTEISTVTSHQVKQCQRMLNLKKTSLSSTLPLASPKLHRVPPHPEGGKHCVRGHRHALLDEVRQLVQGVRRPNDGLLTIDATVNSPSIASAYRDIEKKWTSSQVSRVPPLTIGKSYPSGPKSSKRTWISANRYPSSIPTQSSMPWRPWVVRSGDVRGVDLPILWEPLKTNVVRSQTRSLRERCQDSMFALRLTKKDAAFKRLAALSRCLELMGTSGSVDPYGSPHAFKLPHLDDAAILRELERSFSVHPAEVSNSWSTAPRESHFADFSHHSKKILFDNQRLAGAHRPKPGGPSKTSSGTGAKSIKHSDEAPESELLARVLEVQHKLLSTRDERTKAAPAICSSLTAFHSSFETPKVVYFRWFLETRIRGQLLTEETVMERTLMRMKAECSKDIRVGKNLTGSIGDDSKPSTEKPTDGARMDCLDISYRIHHSLKFPTLCASGLQERRLLRGDFMNEDHNTTTGLHPLTSGYPSNQVPWELLGFVGKLSSQKPGAWRRSIKKPVASTPSAKRQRKSCSCVCCSIWSGQSPLSVKSSPGEISTSRSRSYPYPTGLNAMTDLSGSYYEFQFQNGIFPDSVPSLTQELFRCSGGENISFEPSPHALTKTLCLVFRTAMAEITKSLRTDEGTMSAVSMLFAESSYKMLMKLHETIHISNRSNTFVFTTALLPIYSDGVPTGITLLIVPVDEPSCLAFLSLSSSGWRSELMDSPSHHRVSASMTRFLYPHLDDDKHPPKVTSVSQYIANIISLCDPTAEPTPCPNSHVERIFYSRVPEKGVDNSTQSILIQDRYATNQLSHCVLGRTCCAQSCRSAVVPDCVPCIGWTGLSKRWTPPLVEDVTRTRLLEGHTPVYQLPLHWMALQSRSHSFMARSNHGSLTTPFADPGNFQRETSRASEAVVRPMRPETLGILHNSPEQTSLLGKGLADILPNISRNRRSMAYGGVSIVLKGALSRLMKVVSTHLGVQDDSAVLGDGLYHDIHHLGPTLQFLASLLSQEGIRLPSDGLNAKRIDMLTIAPQRRRFMLSVILLANILNNLYRGYEVNKNRLSGRSPVAYGWTRSVKHHTITPGNVTRPHHPAVDPHSPLVRTIAKRLGSEPISTPFTTSMGTVVSVTSPLDDEVERLMYAESLHVLAKPSTDAIPGVDFLDVVLSPRNSHEATDQPSLPESPCIHKPPKVLEQVLLESCVKMRSVDEIIEITPENVRKFEVQVNHDQWNFNPNSTNVIMRETYSQISCSRFPVVVGSGVWGTDTVPEIHNLHTGTMGDLGGFKKVKYAMSNIFFSQHGGVILREEDVQCPDCYSTGSLAFCPACLPISCEYDENSEFHIEFSIGSPSCRFRSVQLYLHQLTEVLRMSCQQLGIANWMEILALDEFISLRYSPASQSWHQH
eukprot:GHVH01004348.1.p1 GENE.GHVH01004348.1~~GHVH01004348.1.p1  ORF type:complete len:1911 (-),score=194.92 GHVH01004348.1:657-6389(-)